MIPIYIPILISIGINLIFFALAVLIKTDVFTDITYSLAFILMAIFLFLLRKTLIPEQGILLIFVIIWALRLGSYLFTRILKTKVDHRFDDKRDNPVKFGIFWFLQAMTVWITMLPVYGLMAASPYEGPAVLQRLLLIIGAVVWIAGFAIEAIADYQKYRFKNVPENAERFMNQGLWKYARHPNYFGEILVWWGITIIAVPFFQRWQFLSLTGPLFITLMLLFVSGVPVLEKSWEKKWGEDPEFQEYMEYTRLLVPWPQKPA